MRFLRCVAGGLLLLQLNLLGISALHHHDEDDWVAGNSSPACSRAQEHAKQNLSDLAPCPVCQIVRLSAVRPAVVQPTPEPAQRHYFALDLPTVLPYSPSPAAAYGRAPPLA